MPMFRAPAHKLLPGRWITNSLLLAMTDRELVARIAPLRGTEGWIQATGPRAGPGRRARAAAAAGATGAADGARRTGQAGSRALEHSQGSFRRGWDARKSGRRTARSASRRLRICAAQCAAGFRHRTIFLFRPTRSTGPCRATRCWWKWSRRRPMGGGMGRIVRVLERRNPTVVGVFHYARSDRALGHIGCAFRRAHDAAHSDSRGQETACTPMAKLRTPHRVLGAESGDAATPMSHDHDLEGLVVDVEITSWPTPTRPPVGRVIEVLGDRRTTSAWMWR